jgi:hypothetical protein
MTTTFDSSSITFDSTSYTFDGGVANGYTLSAAAGIFALTGEAVTFTAPATLTAATGFFSLTGEAAQLAPGNLSAYTLLANAGIFNLLGAPSVSNLQLDSAAGVFGLVGEAAQLGQGITALTLAAAAGVFSLDGIAANLFTTGQGFYVTAVTAGSYRGVDYAPGDTFYLYSIVDFSDATLNAQPNGNEYAPGWMVRAAAGTPPYTAESQAPYPTFPAVDPARRFVL